MAIRDKNKQDNEVKQFMNKSKLINKLKNVIGTADNKPASSCLTLGSTFGIHKETEKQLLNKINRNDSRV